MFLISKRKTEKKIKVAKEKLAYELGREATMEELAVATELSLEDVVTAVEANSEVESIYKIFSKGKQLMWPLLCTLAPEIPPSNILWKNSQFS